MKRFIVVGLGNFGSAVAETLQSLGHDVAALDVAQEPVDRMARSVSRAAVGDGTEAETLRRMGAEDADAAVVSTGDDITASAMCTLVLKELGVPEVYVKVVSEAHTRLIEKMGVTETVFPERESGMRLGKRISSHSLLNYVTLGQHFSLQEMAVPAEWVGKSLRELELPNRFEVSVVAVHDFLGDEIRPVPDPDAPLKESDTLLMAGVEEKLARVARGD